MAGAHWLKQSPSTAYAIQPYFVVCKLQNLVTSHHTLLWFESYLTNRQQFTRVATSLSEPLTITHGVPQGSILGPTFFSLYMNDLPEVIKFSNIESYIDGTNVYFLFASKDTDSCLRQVTEDLQHVQKSGVAPTIFWLILTEPSLSCLGWGKLSPSCPVTSPYLSLVKIVPVTSAKDLGVTLDANLTFNDHIASLTSLASSLLSKLVQINRVQHLFSRDALYIILNSLVFSKLFYCSAVWSGTSKENIHKLQLMQNFAGRILNTKRFDHITPVLHELGWFTIWQIATALTWCNHDL